MGKLRCWVKDCRKPISRPLSQIRGRVFCSRQCTSRALTKYTIKPCSNCTKDVRVRPHRTRRSKLTYCSAHCMHTHAVELFKQGKPSVHFKTGINSYRSLALKAHGEFCQNKKCPIPFKHGPKMLDVHHKDGNRQHNTFENLEVLCVWCHALETRKQTKVRRG